LTAIKNNCFTTASPLFHAGVIPAVSQRYPLFHAGVIPAVSQRYPLFHAGVIPAVSLSRRQ
jgi:hypothetical protein